MHSRHKARSSTCTGDQGKGGRRGSERKRAKKARVCVCVCVCMCVCVCERERERERRGGTVTIQKTQTYSNGCNRNRVMPLR